MSEPNLETDTEEAHYSCWWRWLHFVEHHWDGLLIVIIPIILLPILLLEPVLEFRCMYIVALMALYWITEILPLYITGMIPAVAFPVMNILDANAVCHAYFNNTLLIFWAGLAMALVIEYSNLHRRIAYGSILIIGCSPRRLHFGIVFVTMFLSMWISNSATAAMFCPIIKVLLVELESQGFIKLFSDKPAKEGMEPLPSKIVLCYYLSVAYSATIGGCGTLIGTGTNLVFKGIYEARFPEAPTVDFVAFMAFSAPIVLVQTILVYIWLEIMYMGLLRPNSKAAKEIYIGKEGARISRGVILEKYKELGPPSVHEIQVSLIFLLMIILFFTSKPGLFVGWAELLPGKVKNSVPIVFVVILLFLLPMNYAFLWYLVGKRPEYEGVTHGLIPWSYIQNNLPWGLMFLLGGGFALARGVEASGFAHMIGESLSILKVLPSPLIQLLCIVAGAFLTAFSSNTAICNILIPVLNELSIAIQIHPLYLTLPAGLGCGLAFFLPVSTPPNAIVSSYSNIRTKDMAIGGIGPTVITILLLYLGSQFWMQIVFPYISELPEWFTALAPTPKPVTDDEEPLPAPLIGMGPIF